MLDALKTLAGGGKAAQKQAEELEALIATAREERTALSAMLTQVTMRAGKLTETGKTLEAVGKTAGTATETLEVLTKRLDEMQRQASVLSDVEKRAQLLEAAISQAQGKTERLIAPDGDLEKHRRDIQGVASAAAEVQSVVETVKRERTALEEVQKQIQKAHEELRDVRQSVEQAATLRTELEQLRGVATQLTQDYSKAREISREADDDAFAALEAVKDIEKRLGRLAQLQELGRTTDEKLTSLNSLAEHVTQKTRVLEGQKHIVDRAVVEINHVNELVWKMDAQISKVNEGFREVARGEELIAKVDTLNAETRVRMETAERTRSEFMAETARLEQEGRELVEFMRASAERIALEKKESEVLEQRLRTLHDAVQASETRLETLAVHERQLAHLPTRFEEFGGQFESLAKQADDLAGRQANLETLRERLGQVEDMSAKASAQFESLKQSRADLETLRKEIHDFHQSYAEAAQLRDKLGADRMALESFTDRLASFRARVPELEATMGTILEKMTLVDEGNRSAARISEVATELDDRLARITARTQVVEMLETRLNSLHLISSEVDAKVAQQLARRVELDTVKSELDGVITQMVDAQHKLEAVSSLQSKLLPMDNRLAILQDRLEKTGTRVAEVKRDEATLAEQEARLTELTEASRALAADTAERMTQVHALTEALARAGSAKDEMIDELARVQARQREALARAESAEEQLRRAETMYSSLEQRRSQLVFSEKKLAAVEIRMAELTRMAADIDTRMRQLNERDAIVSAVKAEVESVHQISARSREDLQYMSAHRDEVVALRRQVQDLLSRAGEVAEKIAEVEARRRDVDEVQTKASLAANLLSDVRVHHETVTEQKAVIDHLNEKLANVDFVMQEAQNTLRMLNQERELAQRIEQSIKQLRTRASGSEEGRQAG